MSERASDRAAAGNSFRFGSNAESPGQTGSPPSNPTALRPVLGHRVVSGTPPISQAQPENAPHPFELPPLAGRSSDAEGRNLPSVPRLGGVPSILNPLQADEPEWNRRRKASHLDSPASSTQSLPPILSGARPAQSSSALPSQSPVAQYTAPAERAPRRILTPRSPSLHRAASLGQLNPSAATISAQTTPFPSSPRGRTYTVEPGVSGAPPLPTPAAGRQVFGVSAPDPPTDAARRASTGATRGRGLSPSVSPTTSYSSYSQTGYTSPAVQYDPTTLPTLSAPYTSGGEASMSGQSTASAPPEALGSGRQRQMGIPISSSGGQNIYQMLTLETTSGTVQLPVDVQAASRVADEKRRRNAGASARFRQRRKEKEKEASTSISRLEQQVKELGEDVDFYRRERDFLAGILGHVPGGERHFPRPTSPRHRRASGVPLPGPGGAESGGYSTTHEPGPRSPDEGRNVRRRTSTFSLPPPPFPPQAQHQPPVPGLSMQPGYGPMVSQPPPSALQSPSGRLPPPPMDLSRGPLPFPAQMSSSQPAQPHPGPPQVMQAVPQTGPYNPFASDRRPSGPSNQQRESR